MTYEEREQIFAKEVLTLDDFMKLFSVGKSSACTLMGNAKRGIEFSGKNLRLKKEGQIQLNVSITGAEIAIILESEKEKPSREVISTRGIFKADCDCAEITQ